MRAHPDRGGQPVAIISLLALAMATATYLTGALSVVSSHVIEDLGISRTQLGLAFTVFALTGAAMSPAIGSVADRNIRFVMIGLFITGAAGILIASVATSYWALVLATVVAGLALAAGNPVTNRVISLRISKRHRGLAVGLKQSGPPLALLVAGVSLAPLATLLGWRPAIALTVILPATGLLAAHRLFSSSEQSRDDEHRNVAGQGKDGTLTVLSFLSFGTAMGLSAVIAFVPLYGQEAIGVSPETAGFIAAAMGLTGVLARILWGNGGWRLGHHLRALLAISVMSVVAIVAIRFANLLGVGSLWLGAVLAGASMFAWHAVAWLAIIDRTSSDAVGRASGVMQVATGIGFAAGPALMGLVVDMDPTYATGWNSGILLFIATAALTLWAVTRVRVNDPS